MKGEILELAQAFYNRQIDSFSLYIEGIGGFFVGRVKDGMVIGYNDRSKRLGSDDHVTLFFDDKGLKGLHRKVVDSEATVYMRYDADYFTSSGGLQKLSHDMSEKNNMPFFMKPLLLVVYKTLENFYQFGLETSMKDVSVIENSYAKKLGLKSPCIYMKTGYVARFLLPLYGKTIVMQALAHNFWFREKPSRGFVEQDFPGSKITKHPRKTDPSEH